MKIKREKSVVKKDKNKKIGTSLKRKIIMSYMIVSKFYAHYCKRLRKPNEKCYNRTRNNPRYNK